MMRPSSSSPFPLFITLSVFVSLLKDASSEMTCESQCQPWMWAQPRSEDKDEPCKSGDRMDFRMIIGDVQAAGEGKSASEDTGYRTYFFCPKVDAFSSFTLNGAAEFANSTHTDVYLAAYGAGKSSEVRVPDETQESYTLVYQESPPTAQCKDGGAVASFLLYNITLKDGNFHYKNGDPIGNGFVNSCSDDGSECLFDSDSFCIGDAATSRWNCAKCVSTSSTLTVLASFYGTDSAGDPLLSGSSNPINFRQFAIGNVYSDIGSDIQSEADKLKGDVGL